MGFLDKAKKLAEDAQAKADELQKQFNEKQAAGATTGEAAPPVEYDQHGRPIGPAQPPSHSVPVPVPANPVGDAPLTPSAPPAPPVGDAPAPSAPPPASGPPAPPGPPAGGIPTPPPPPNSAPGGPQEGYEPPPLTSGDPLAG